MQWGVIDAKTGHKFSLIVWHNNIKSCLIRQRSVLIENSAFEEDEEVLLLCGWKQNHFELVWITQMDYSEGILSAGTFKINSFLFLEQTTSEKEQSLMSAERC